MKKLLVMFATLAIVVTSMVYVGTGLAQSETPPTPEPPAEGQFYQNFPGFRPGFLRGLLDNLRSRLPNFMMPGAWQRLLPNNDFPEGMQGWFDQAEDWEMHSWSGYLGPLHSYMLEALAPKLGLSVEELQKRIEAGERPYEIARAQGFSDEQIQVLFEEAASDALEAAVAAGAISQEQAEVMRKMMDSMLPRMWQFQEQMDDSGWEYNSFRGQRTPFGMMGPYYEYRLQIYAQALGLGIAEVESRLQAGETVAQIAQSQGLEVEEFRAQVVAAAQEVLKQAVADGKLTQEQADRLLQLLERWEDAGFGTQMSPWGTDRMRMPRHLPRPNRFRFIQP